MGQRSQRKKGPANKMKPMQGPVGKELVVSIGERELKLFIDNLMTFTGKIDPDGNLVMINRSAIEAAGVSYEDVLNMHFADTYWWSYDPAVKRRIRELVDRSLEGEILISEEKIRGSENLILIQFSLRPVFDNKGAVEYVIAEGRDLSAIKEAERKADLFRNVIESLSDFAATTDMEGRIGFVNSKALNGLGFTEKEVVGRLFWECPWFARSPEEIIGRIEKCIKKAINGLRERIETDIFTNNGKKLYVYYSFSPLLDENSRVTGVVVEGGDITELKNAEEDLRNAKEDAEELNKQLEQAIERANQQAMEAQMATLAKSQFLANMSHEIRTPMNGIIGFTDMLLDSDLNEEQIDYAKTVKRSAEALLSLINDILDFSKIEAGELDIEEIDFDLELLAYDVCDLIRPKIGLKPVELLCHIDDNLPSYVKGDPLRFRQVLTNLMGNAPKFTEEGEIELSLDMEKEEGDRMKIHVRVRDTGIGVPMERLDAIFEPFQQADGSTTRKYGGTGLGLSICKQISNLMGGDVWVESPATPQFSGHSTGTGGPGSIFHFTAWLRKTEVKEPVKPAPVSLSNMKVLVVDDNMNHLKILTHTLERVGMTVAAFANGEKVLPALEDAFVQKKPFDLCVSDLQMPGMDGYALARQIRDSHSPISRIPMIAVSSSIERDAKKCGAAGFDGFLSKPIRKEKLYQMIERIVGAKEMTDRSEMTGTSDKSSMPEGGQRKSSQIITQHSVREDMKRSVRILLAEDNPVNQKLAKMMLSKAGYHVEIANDGKEAVERYSDAPDDFDLIFMDIQMPVMDGLEATREIRRYETKSDRHVPIVAMTANAMKGDRERCIKAGMDDYTTKPIKREVVFDIIKSYGFMSDGTEGQS